jgi:DNA adenine methylase
MAVLLAKEPSAFEAVNDLHGDLTNLARVVRDEGLSGRLFWRLRRTLAAEGLFRESLAAIRSGPAPSWEGSDPDSRLDRAYHYFVVSWLGVNGVAGSKRKGSSYARRYTSGGGDPGVRFAAAVESLPDWHERLRRVLIYSACGLEVCERVEDRDGTVVYCDPPYLVKGSSYDHDFTPEDHRRLAAALGRFMKTRVVVSYYDHPDLDVLYPGWVRVELPVTKAMVNGTNRRVGGPVSAPEVLLVRN